LHGVIRAEASSYEEKLQESLDKKEELAQQLEDAEAAKNELEQLKQEAQEVSAKLSADIADIGAYIEQLDAELNEVTERLNDYEERIQTQEDELVQIEAELVEAQETEATQYENMKKRIRYIYENGESSLWEVILNAENLSDILNQSEYVMRIAEYDDTLLDRYQLAKEAVITAKAKKEASLEELYTLKEATEFERDNYLELTATKSEQMQQYMASYDMNEDMLEDYADQISDKSSAIDEIEQLEEARAGDEQQLRDDEAERLRKEEEERQKQLALEAQNKELAAARLTAAAGITLTDETSINKMIWPLPGDGRTYSGFGYRIPPTAGASTFHRGVDIGGEYGATIVAVLAGTVQSTGYNWSSGNYVKISHGNGLVTVYFHASKILVTAGEYIQQGEAIALVGSTGVSTGAHLHFGVMIDGTYVDPMQYISYDE